MNIKGRWDIQSPGYEVYRDSTGFAQGSIFRDADDITPWTAVVHEMKAHYATKAAARRSVVNMLKQRYADLGRLFK